MSPLSLRIFPQVSRQVPARSFIASRRYFAASSEKDTGTQNSRPGWKGRDGEDHVLHREGNDAQSAPSREARQDKEQGKEGSQAISQKDERDSNKRAKDDHPEAPEPVIGMNAGKIVSQLEVFF